MHRVLNRDPSSGGWFAEVYYYDLNTNRLYIGIPSEIPPVPAPSGASADGASAGVRAYVYSCGQCDPDHAFIGLLETYTPEAKATAIAVADYSADPLEAGVKIEAGHRIKLPGQEWRPFWDYPELMRSIQAHCGEVMKEECLPSKLGRRLDIPVRDTGQAHE